MTDSVFKDNVVVITGASAGIGLEISKMLARQGACLVLAARNPQLIGEAVEACRLLGAKAIGVPTDVADREQCRALIERAVSEFGRLDTLVNNAGITAINYFGAVYCTWYALPHLKKTRGRLVAVSSLTGKNGVPTRTLYAGTKHAMAGFFDSLRIELRDQGVSVTVIYPGFVATDIAERALGPDGKPLGVRPVNKNAIMTVEECARQTIDAMSHRKREVVMTGRARLGMIVKAIWPDIVDRIAERGIRRGR